MPNTDIDPKILERVRALLAKAESSDFPNEAASFTAKAQSLMASHAIDQALLESSRGGGEVTSVRIVVPAPYAKNKCILLNAAARPNNCRVVVGVPDDEFDIDLVRGVSRNDRIVTMFGHRADLDVVELLFTSLLVQATNVMLRHGSMRNEMGENCTRSFRHAFLLGFADEVADRLLESQQHATSTADRVASGALLPVLVERRDMVDRAVESAFPRLGKLRTSVSNGSGYFAGQHAGRRADVGGRRVGGGQGALSA